MQKKIEELKKEKDQFSLEQYQSKYMEIIKSNMSRESQILLSQKFKDVQNSTKTDFVKLSKKKLPWSETLNKIIHIIPDGLYKKLQES